MAKILSIVVPTYNMEKYLQHGLDSLLIPQGLDRIEVLVINDGSKDQSSAIAHSYAQKYPGVFIVVDKPNGNYGSCINAALKIAKGKYIKVMDADDYFITSSLLQLVNTLAELDVDLVITDYVKAYTSGKTIDYTFNLPKQKILAFDEVYQTKAMFDILLPAITYKTNILRDINYHQTEGISYTDLEWCFSPITQVNSIYYLDTCLYCYLMGREGQTMDPAVYARSIPQRIQCFSALMHSIKDIPLTESKRIFTTNQLVKHAKYFYRYFLIDNPECDRSLLYSLDEEMKALNKYAYHQCAEFCYRLHIPYHYVKKWRENDTRNIPWYIRLYGKILDYIGNLHIKMMRENPNEER